MISLSRAMLSKAISQYVSAILLSMIVLSAGAFLYVHSIRILDARYQQLESELLRSEKTFSQSLAILYAFIDNNGDLVIAMVSAEYPVKIFAIYINSTPAICSIAIGSDTYILPEQHPEIPPHSLAVATCSTSASYAEVKIVFGGGELVVYAEKI